MQANFQSALCELAYAPTLCVLWFHIINWNWAWEEAAEGSQCVAVAIGEDISVTGET